MSLTYNSWFASFFNRVAAVSTSTPLTPGGAVSSYTDPFWLNELPNVIDYAEQRIYREADLLNERVTDQSGVLTPTNRAFTLPTAIGTWVVPERIYVITPVSAGPTTGVRNSLQPVSMEYLLQGWPNDSSANGLPQVYTTQRQTATTTTIWLGPAPDQAYAVEVTGTQRPTALSSANPTTYLTTVLPDLFFAATMIGAAAYMRDFGQQSDNPQMAVSWESQYQTLFKSALSEESRKMYRSAGWTAQRNLPETMPPRE